MLTAAIGPTFPSPPGDALRPAERALPRAARNRPPSVFALAGALLVEVLLLALLVFLVHPHTNEPPEPIEVEVVIERPPPPPPAAETAVPEARGNRSGTSSGDSETPSEKPQSTQGAADSAPAQDKPTQQQPSGKSAPDVPRSTGAPLPLPAPALDLPNRSRQPAPVTAPPRQRSSPGRASPNVQKVEGEAQGAGDAYLNTVDALLKQHCLYPERARALGLTGFGILSIAVNRAGRVVETQVTKSSGAQIIDQAAVGCVAAATPLPPPPAYRPEDPLVLFWNFRIEPAR